MFPVVDREKLWFRWRVALTAIALSASAVLLFARLGHYALWDDEANTALFAGSIWRTGDESAIVGHNIVAYRDGAELYRLKARVLSPLSVYFVAPFTAIDQGNAGFVRLPFALCGWICVGLILLWLWRDDVDWRLWVQVLIALLGNAAFFLYCRQCRYYGLSILLSAAIVYLYLHWDGGRRSLLGMGLLSAALLATQYLQFITLHAIIALDYAIWGRRWRPLRWGDWLMVLLPSIIVGCVVLPIFNPLALNPIKGQPNSVWMRLHRVWLYCRDTDAGEFGSALVWLAAPVVVWIKRNVWLLRALVALVVYLVLTGLMSPEPGVIDGDIRYASPAILLCIAIAAMVFASFKGRWTWVGIALGLVGAGTNLLNGGPFLQRGLRSTIYDFAAELYDPPLDPYRVTADWINQNVPPLASIWTLPDFAEYPLMYHAPKAIYAWQLHDPPQPQFKGLASVHFMGREMPNYIIAFGAPELNLLTSRFRSPHGLVYRLVAALPVNGMQLNRPEIFWRSFRALPCDVARGQGIYCFKLEIERPAPDTAPTQP